MKNINFQQNLKPLLHKIAIKSLTFLEELLEQKDMSLEK